MSMLSIVAGTFNEEENVEEFHRRITLAMRGEAETLDYELIFIDNASTDRTVEVLRGIAATDRRVRVIVNARNFGPVRSGMHGLLQARGDAVILMASDLQDPPELIPEFVEKWRSGAKVVLGQKVSSEESALFYLVRSAYYKLVRRLSDIELLEHVTGFGLYDRMVVETVRGIDDPYPYLRGLVSDLGYPRALVPYRQPARKRGFSKNNFYALWDMAMLGITSHSKVPLRLAVFAGLFVGALSFLVAGVYLLYKLLYWDSFQLGTAPIVVGIFFLGGVQLVFIGILGEYIGSIHTMMLRRPRVIERERINFD